MKELCCGSTSCVSLAYIPLQGEDLWQGLVANDGKEVERQKLNSYVIVVHDQLAVLPNGRGSFGSYEVQVDNDGGIGLGSYGVNDMVLLSGNCDNTSQNVDNKGVRTLTFKDDTRTSEVFACQENKIESSSEYPPSFKPRLSSAKDGLMAQKVGLIMLLALCLKPNGCERGKAQARGV